MRPQMKRDESRGEEGEIEREWDGHYPDNTTLMDWIEFNGRQSSILQDERAVLSPAVVE